MEETVECIRVHRETTASSSSPAITDQSQSNDNMYARVQVENLCKVEFFCAGVLY